MQPPHADPPMTPPIKILAEAYWLALQSLISTNESAAYNPGNGNDFSDYQVIQAANKVCGKLGFLGAKIRHDHKP